MRIAILSDIHGNLEALEAVLADIEGTGTGLLWSLGDIVGYGPSPAECVEIVRSRAAVSLRGNHDAAVTGSTPIDYFNAFARSALEWTVTRLDAAQSGYLSALPIVHRAPGLLLVHASPVEPERWHYIRGLADVEEHFGAFSEKLCFVGHSHQPGIYSVDRDRRIAQHPGRDSLRPGMRHIVNAGSVGQPRDRDPRACYALLDDAEATVELRRVPYPVAKTQAKMRAAGLPGYLSERLAVGL